MREITLTSEEVAVLVEMVTAELKSFGKFREKDPYMSEPYVSTLKNILNKLTTMPTTKECSGTHCKCMEKTCPNNHYADCVKHNPALKIVPSPRLEWCGACKKEHGYDCPLDTPQEWWMSEFSKLHYEPVHEEGGMCWCGVTFSKEEGEMHIRHKEQRIILKSFISETLKRERELHRSIIKGIIDEARAANVKEVSIDWLEDTLLNEK